MKSRSKAKKLSVLLDNIYGAVTGKIRSDRTDWNLLGNAALMHVDRKSFTASLKGVPALTRQQKKQVRDFYRPYLPWVSDRYHRLYTYESQGRFDPRYIPEDIHFMYIDRFYCDREKARFADNKCLYEKMFPDILQPETVCMRKDGRWYNGRSEEITKKEVLRLVAAREEIIVKKAVNSEGGSGVFFLRGAEKTADGSDGSAGSRARRIAGIPGEFADLMRGIDCDTIVQEPVKQHPAMEALHPGSVNTLRIMSLLTGEEIRVLGAIVKFGTGSARVDNSSSGGIICGVDPVSGQLSGYGLYHDGKLCSHHPDLNYAFPEMYVPHLDSAFTLVRNAHRHIPDFRLVSWDVAIGRDGNAVLIEANLCLGSINAFQVFNGPLFGDDTERILAEVFGSRRRFPFGIKAVRKQGRRSE